MNDVGDDLGNIDVVQAYVHTIIAVVLALLLMVCEGYQLFRGERILKRCTGKIQILRVVSLVLSLICYVSFKAAYDMNLTNQGSNQLGFSAMMEWLGFFFSNNILFLYCFVPIKATQSVFALSGRQSSKEKRVARSFVGKVE